MSILALESVCKKCVSRDKNSLLRLGGVRKTVLSYEAKKAIIEYNENRQIDL